MKIQLLILSFFLCSFSFSQNVNCEKKLNILKKVFREYEIKTYGNEKVFETKVWEKHATINFKQCYVADFSNGIVALAFNIYLSDDPDQYQYMIEEGIQMMGEITENSLFQGGDQRLIQVIFYDTKHNKFLGKGKGFPLKNFEWLISGMGDVATINCIEHFKKLDAGSNTCILTITECPSCLGGLNYVFKYHNGTVLTSEPVDACYEKVYVKANKMYMKVINNCYEYEYDGIPPITEDQFLFQW